MECSAPGVATTELGVCFTWLGYEECLIAGRFMPVFRWRIHGAVQISVGLVTNFKDVQGFLAFARGLLT